MDKTFYGYVDSSGKREPVTLADIEHYSVLLVDTAAKLKIRQGNQDLKPLFDPTDQLRAIADQARSLGIFGKDNTRAMIRILQSDPIVFLNEKSEAVGSRALAEAKNVPHFSRNLDEVADLAEVSAKREVRISQILGDVFLPERLKFGVVSGFYDNVPEILKVIEKCLPDEDPTEVEYSTFWHEWFNLIELLHSKIQYNVHGGSEYFVLANQLAEQENITPLQTARHFSVLKKWNDHGRTTEQARSEVQRHYYNLLGEISMENNKMKFVAELNEITEISFSETGISMEELSSLLSRAWQETLPTTYLETHERIKKMWPYGEETFPDHAWGKYILQLQGLKARARRSEYDAWINHLDPLVKEVIAEWQRDNDTGLDPSNPDHGKILHKYVQDNGMVYSPTLLNIYVRILSSGDNMEEIGNIQEKRMLLSHHLLDDSLGIEHFDSGLSEEIFNTLIPPTNWKVRDSIRYLIETWSNTANKNPELAKSPEGYRETVIKVPLKEKNRDLSEEETIRNALANPEVQHKAEQLSNIFKQAAEIKSPGAWWHEKLSEFADQLSIKIEDIGRKILKTPDERQRFGLSKQRDQLQELLNRTQNEPLPASEDITSEQQYARVIESFVRLLPKKEKTSRELLQVISAAHMLDSMAATRKESIKPLVKEPLTETTLNKWSDHLQNYVLEHYLNPNQENHFTGHTPLSQEAISQIQAAWSLNKVREHPMIMAEQKIREITRGNMSESRKTIDIALVPARGVGRVFSGDIGDACYVSCHEELAQGQYPNLTAFIFVTHRNTPQETLEGSVLVIETSTPDGQPVLLVRANNPRQGLISRIDSDAFTRLFLNEMRALARRRGIDIVVVPRDDASKSSSNRPDVSEYYKKEFSNQNPLALKNEPETNFNAYTNWDPSSSYAVVPIVS